MKAKRIIKTLFFLVIYIVLFSCQKNSSQEYKENLTENQQDNKQVFSDYHFKIDCPCELKKDFIDTENNFYTYRCNSEDNEAVYSFSIKDLKNELREYKTEIEKQNFYTTILKGYKDELEANNINYIEPYIYGFKGIEYTVPTGNIINKQAVFVSNGFIYTFNVTSNKNIIDNQFSDFISSFELFHKSPKYSYSIEIPKGYSQQEIIGKNVDLKYINDKGYAIVVVVNKIPTGEKATIDDLYSLPDSYWIEHLPQSEINILKKGKIYVDNTEGMVISYTAKEHTDKEPLYYSIYTFVKNDFVYALTTTCKEGDIHEMHPVFFRVSHSLKFSNIKQ